MITDEEIENEVKRLSKLSTAPDKDTPDWMESDIRNGIKAGILLQQNKVSDSYFKDAFLVKCDRLLRDKGNSSKETNECISMAFDDTIEEYAYIVNERKDNVVVNDWKIVIKNRIDYFNDRYHYYEANRLSDALININELIPPSDFESQPQKEEVNEDELLDAIIERNKSQQTNK